MSSTQGVEIPSETQGEASKLRGLNAGEILTKRTNCVLSKSIVPATPLNDAHQVGLFYMCLWRVDVH